MSRVEKYKEKRREKLKIRVLAFCLITLVITGICSTDYSVNKIMNKNGKLSLISFAVSDGFLDISILNKKTTLNVSYLERDIKKLKSKFTGIFNKI